MRCSRFPVGAALLALAVPALASAEGEAARTYKGAERSQAVRPESREIDVRDLPVVRDWEPGDPIKEIPRRHWPRPGTPRPAAPPHAVDPLLALQDAVPTAGNDSRFGTVGVSVPGQGFSGVNPPDPSGDVGPNHYIQAINGSGGATFTIYSKTGALLAGPSAMDALGSGSCASGLGDPIVLYDQLAGRWLMSEFSNSGNYMCVYVSKTSDPVSGGWWAYAFQAPSFPDYPKYGVWPDAYYVGTNESSSAVYAFDRAKMLAGQPATFQRFTAPKMAGFGFQLLTPADADGATAPPAGSRAIFMRHRDDEAHNSGSNNTSQDYLEIWEFKVDWTNSANSSFTGPTNLPVTEFDSTLCGLTSFSCVPQPGSTTKLDPLREPIMYKLQYRNFGSYQSMVGAFATDVATDRAGVRWFELRKTTGSWSLAKEGTYAPDTTHRWMASAAQDGQGNLAVAYSVSASSSVYPGLRYAGRLAGDPAGTLAQGETTIVSGSAANSSNRWGDYFQLGVDPTDDCTFWFTGQYSPSSSWATRVATFKFDQCGTAPAPAYALAASPGSLALNPGSSGTSSITVSSSNGFNSAVALTASGLPAGVTASFSPSSVTPPSNGSASSTLTLTASSSAAAGTATITITGTNGTTTKTTTVTLTVNAAGQAVYDATLRVPKCAAVGNACDSGPSLLLGRGSLGPEPNQPNTINGSCADGTSGTFHGDESNDRIRVVSVDGTPFAAGKQVRVEATVWAYSSYTSDKLDLYYAASATSPSWTLIGTFTPPGAGAQTITATYTLPTGSLQAVRARFRYNGSASPCSTGSYDDHDDIAFAVGAGSSDTTAPTTSITAPSSGSTVSGTTTVSASASDNVGVTRVEFLVDGALASTDTTSPYSFSWNTTAVSNGSHTLQSRAYDAAGNAGTSSTVTVTVSNSTGGTELLVNGGFEGSSSPWVRSTYFYWSGSSSASAHSGTGYTYAGNRNSTTTQMYQQVAIPSTASGTLTFWLRVITNETTTTTVYDRLYVEVRNTSGTLLGTIATYSNLDKNTAYVQKSLNLSAYKGQTVRLQFRVTTDSSLTTTFRIDDVSLK